MNKLHPRISVIIPLYNSERNIKKFLDSALKSKFKNFEIILNDDKRSNDKTLDMVKRYIKKGLQIKYLRENISMAQGRKQGAKYAKGEVLLHLDSDMEITEDLLEEIDALLSRKYDALVIPEDSVGTTFWAKCKWLEKKCYEGVVHMESLRAIKKTVYDMLGGHDEQMVFSEDKDLDIRVRNAGYKVGRTQNIIIHHEGELHLFDTMRKKANYSHSANIFAQKHPKEFRWQINIVNRYVIYIKNAHYLFSDPLIYIGMILMKTLEFSYSSGVFMKKKFLI